MAELPVVSTLLKRKLKFCFYYELGTIRAKVTALLLFLFKSWFSFEVDAETEVLQRALLQPGK